MIDWTRSYGRCCGDTRYAYSQDGKYFDGNGNEIIEDVQETIAPEENVPPPIEVPTVPKKLTLRERYEERFGPGSFTKLPSKNRHYYGEKRLRTP